jgi:hypothetical protein
MTKATASARVNTNTTGYKVSIRMYCMGTGDCFVYKFFKGNSHVYTIMIDCGSCSGEQAEFVPYVTDLIGYVDNHINLLVITHEHNDHINGFAKCKSQFASPALRIDEAWMAWTEDPIDPEGRAAELRKKRKEMRAAFALGMREVKSKGGTFISGLTSDFYQPSLLAGQKAFLDGLDTLAGINLDSDNGQLNVTGQPLAGMTAIKDILEKKGTAVKYVHPGQTQKIKELPGILFHVLGPPYDRESIFLHEREGKDVFKRHAQPYAPSLALKSFLNLENTGKKDLPFEEEYVFLDPQKRSLQSTLINRIPENTSEILPTKTLYDTTDSWRKIDADWLYSVGTLAIRLNSHINNTSVVLALEAKESGDTLLLAADAEFGSWQSWFKIDHWEEKGRGKKHFVEDLLNRTVFYKVSHHLSFNGTSLDGLKHLTHQDLAAMATLDRNRINSRWKSTMPNPYLLKELIQRCKGKVFVMDETGLTPKPSDTLDPKTLGEGVYREAKLPGTDKTLYKEYIVEI